MEESQGSNEGRMITVGERGGQILLMLDVRGDGDREGERRETRRRGDREGFEVRKSETRRRGEEIKVEGDLLVSRILLQE